MSMLGLYAHRIVNHNATTEPDPFNFDVIVRCGSGATFRSSGWATSILPAFFAVLLTSDGAIVFQDLQARTRDRQSTDKVHIHY
ncbi:hypothetical protein E4U16_004111 [Claviceps sp. LM84 group G4]|nr:hypothetical protein E4U16_004111 [Claviceps sp. LM84 group G4]